MIAALPARLDSRLLWGRLASYAALILAVLIVLFPIYWMVITSLKLPREIYRVPALWPKTFTLDNFNKLLADGDFLLAIRNSAIVASTVTSRPTRWYASATASAACSGG